MTTLRDIVTDAFRESGLVQVGLTPEADEFDEALRKLKTIIASLYGNEMGSPLTPISYGPGSTVGPRSTARYDTLTVPANARLLVTADQSYSVYLNPNPADGERFAVVDASTNFGTNPFTVYGNGRNIEGVTSFGLNTDGDARQWFYRADLGNWVVITDLTASSESPFPAEFDEMLILMTAMRIHPRYQVQTAAETVADLRRAKSQFRARYSQVKSMPSDLALRRLSGHKLSGAGYTDTQWGSSTQFGTGEIILDGGSV